MLPFESLRYVLKTFLENCIIHSGSYSLISNLAEHLPAQLVKLAFGMRNNGMYTYIRPSRSMKGRRLCVYKTAAILLMVSLTTYLILTSRLQHLYPDAIMLDGNIISGSKISQPKCTLPTLPLDNPQITKYIVEFKRIECKKPDSQEKEEDWLVFNGSHAAVTEEAKARYKNINCQFSEIERRSDFASRISSPNMQGLSYKFTNTDFIQARCTAQDKKWKSFLAAPRSNVHIPDQRLNVSGPRYNVLLWGHDSLSRNMFMRKLPRAYSYLREKLSGIVLKGYNIVGDGTPQALIPILTGKTELELPETRKRKGSRAKHVNVYPFVWNEYRDKGYLTGFMEDCPKIGTFTYRLKGFDEAPTDFYMRPYFIAAEPEYSDFPDYCIGSVPRHKVMMNYVKDIMNYKKETPKFLFSFHSELSHEQINAIQGADEDMEGFFHELQSSGALNNTVLVVFSDHGNRFASIRESQQGKQEERMPMFMFVFPPSFKKSYTRAFENFRMNSEILSTPFDIHATLQDLLTITSKSEEYFSNPHEKRERQLSLLRPVFPDRTCKDASIEPHWCACLQWHILNVSLPSVQKAANEFVGYLNANLANQTTLCAPLELKQVLWAANLLPSDELLHFKRSADPDGFLPDLSDKTAISKSTLQLKLETLPGMGRFEVSLQHDVKKNSFQFNMRDISRINKYGKQASCVEDNLEHLRKFCFCLNKSEQR